MFKLNKKKDVGENAKKVSKLAAKFRGRVNKNFSKENKIIKCEIF